MPLKHASLTANHRPYAATYADSAARLAATGFPRGDAGAIVAFDASDVGKWAKQEDDGSYWELTDDSPVTWAQRTGAGALANDSVTNPLLANMAQGTIKGRASGAGTGDPVDLTAAQVKTILALSGSDIANTPAGGIAATDVQAAINELDSEKLTQGQADALYEPLGGGGGGGTMTYVLLPNPYPTATSTGGVGSANAVRVLRFFLPGSLTVNRIVFRCGSSGISANFGVGVYSNDGNTLLIDSGPQANAANTTKNIALGAPVALSAGHYWLAWTCDDAGPTLIVQAIATGANAVQNATTVQHGTAANASSGGQLPATLGAIAGADINVPVTKLQN